MKTMILARVKLAKVMVLFLEKVLVCQQKLRQNS